MANDGTPYQNVQSVSFNFWGAPVIQNADGSLFCPGFEGPTYAKNAYDKLKVTWPITLQIAGQGIDETPGVAQIDIQKEHRYDEKKPAGADGSRVTVYGANPAKVTIRITVWTPTQLKVLKEIWKTLFPKDSTQANAYDCYYPGFEEYGIKALMFLGGSGPRMGGTVGTRIYEINAVEFSPPKKKNATKTPKGAAPDGSINDPTKYPKPGSNKKNTGP